MNSGFSQDFLSYNTWHTNQLPQKLLDVSGSSNYPFPFDIDNDQDLLQVPEEDVCVCYVFHILYHKLILFS